jgi:hypothetical protein
MVPADHARGIARDDACLLLAFFFPPCEKFSVSRPKLLTCVSIPDKPFLAILCPQNCRIAFAWLRQIIQGLGFCQNMANAIELPGEANPLTAQNLFNALAAAASSTQQQVRIGTQQLQNWEKQNGFYLLLQVGPSA